MALSQSEMPFNLDGPDAPRKPITIADIVAGLSVALVIIPQSLAYAELAGLPAYVGLFAAAIPLLVFAVFASSPYLQTGPVALTSLLTFAALTSAGLTPETDDYVAGAAVLALLVGVIRLLMGLSKLGWLAYLVSRPVLLGFTNAAAVIILASQLPKALGTDNSVPDGSSLGNAWWSLIHPNNWNFSAIAIAGLTLALMLLGRRVHQLFPGVLIAAAAGLIYAKVGYPASVISDLASIPEGLPSLSFSLDFDLLPSLIVSALVVALVGFAEPSAIARVFARQEKRPWDVNRELIASGLANAAAAVSGAFPVGGSFSRSSLNKLAGASSRWSGAITGAAVLAFLPFASVLDDLPQAVLGGVVVGAAIKLIKPFELMELYQKSKAQGVLAGLTFVGTLVAAPNIHWALAGGVILSVLVSKLEPATIARSAGGQGLAGTKFALSGFCWLGSQAKFRKEIADAVNEAPAGEVTIDTTDVTDFEPELEAQVHTELEHSGRTVVFTRNET